jgi:hypothetical protein
VQFFSIEGLNSELRKIWRKFSTEIIDLGSQKLNLKSRNIKWGFQFTVII